MHILKITVAALGLAAVAGAVGYAVMQQKKKAESDFEDEEWGWPTPNCCEDANCASAPECNNEGNDRKAQVAEKRREVFSAINERQVKERAEVAEVNKEASESTAENLSEEVDSAAEETEKEPEAESAAPAESEIAEDKPESGKKFKK